MIPAHMTSSSGPFPACEEGEQPDFSGMSVSICDLLGFVAQRPFDNYHLNQVLRLHSISQTQKLHSFVTSLASKLRQVMNIQMASQLDFAHCRDFGLGQ